MLLATLAKSVGIYDGMPSIAHSSYYYLSKKVKLDISCESFAKQMIHMNYQTIYFLGIKNMFSATIFEWYFKANITVLLVNFLLLLPSSSSSSWFLINMQVQGQHPYHGPLPGSWLAARMADLTPDLQVCLSWGSIVESFHALQSLSVSWTPYSTYYHIYPYQCS